MRPIKNITQHYDKLIKIKLCLTVEIFVENPYK